MRTSGPAPMLVPPIVTGITRLPYHGRRRLRTRRHLVLMARFDESREQRMRLQGLGLELRMKLDRDVPGMRGQLDDLDELSIERPADDVEAIFSECSFEQAVEFVPMAVAFVDDFALVERVRLRTGLQLTRIRAEPHRSTELVDAEQIAQFVDDVAGRIGRAFGRVRIRKSTNVPRVFHGCPLEAVADAEVRNTPLAGNL